MVRAKFPNNPEWASRPTERQNHDAPRRPEPRLLAAASESEETSSDCDDVCEYEEESRSSNPVL